MFETISTAPPDAILGLSEAFQQDQRPEKINLSVGVYRDDSGETPILQCVRAAEQKWLAEQSSKSYLGIEGLAAYRRFVGQLLFGEAVNRERLAVLQTPGGTGGVRLAAEFVATQFAGSRVFVSNPTWANHHAIFNTAGLATVPYRYLNQDRTGLDFAGLCDDLDSQTVPGDAVLLHACCHNPTGVDPTSQQWQQLGELLAQRRLLPILDFAYQGFGAGLEEDAEGLRTVLRHCPELLVCSSFSKNFGLYGERVGAMTLVAADQASATACMSQLKCLVRANYSNPPQHGAALVTTIAGDPELSSQWRLELAEMRQRIRHMRQQFVDQMAASGVDRDFSFLLQQRGMFSFSGLNPLQVDRLRSEHAVYIVGSGRINVAGMTAENLPRLCQAVAAVLADA